MSRYIKLDTAIEHTNQLYHGDEVEAWLESLPTIEVADLSEEAYEVGYTNGQMAERKRKIEVSEDALKGCDKVDKRFSEDAISREYLKSFEYINKGDFNSVETIREWIDNAPSVIPKPKEGEWIPCSERLPHAEYGESDNVLVTCKSKSIRLLYFNGGNWCYPTGEYYEHRFDKVVAWMPLPKPWKGTAE